MKKTDKDHNSLYKFANLSQRFLVQMICGQGKHILTCLQAHEKHRISACVTFWPEVFRIWCCVLCACSAAPLAPGLLRERPRPDGPGRHRLHGVQARPHRRPRRHPGLPLEGENRELSLSWGREGGLVRPVPGPRPRPGYFQKRALGGGFRIWTIFPTKESFLKVRFENWSFLWVSAVFFVPSKLFTKPETPVRSQKLYGKGNQPFSWKSRPERIWLWASIGRGTRCCNGEETSEEPNVWFLQVEVGFGQKVQFDVFSYLPMKQDGASTVIEINNGSPCRHSLVFIDGQQKHVVSTFCAHWSRGLQTRKLNPESPGRPYAGANPGFWSGTPKPIHTRGELAFVPDWVEELLYISMTNSFAQFEMNANLSPVWTPRTTQKYDSVSGWTCICLKFSLWGHPLA